MAALQIIAALMLFTVTLFGEGFGVSDEELQDLPPMVAKVIRQMNEEMNEMSNMLKTQELENVRQTVVIDQQAEVIGRLEEALISMNRKCKPEVLENGSIKNSSLEERVTLLEIQVTDIREDLTTTDETVADLDEDVNFLFDEQVIQDERLLNLEETSDQVTVELAEINVNIQDIETTTLALDFRVTALEENGGGDGNSSVAELEVRVETLEGTATDHETKITAAETDIEAMETRLTAAEENIQGLQVTDVNHDMRISALEENDGSGSENDTIAFHSALTLYSTIPADSAVVFNEVLLNEGNSYNSTTGVFTVPPGGDGIYYFSVYLLGHPGEYGTFDMYLNDDVICSMFVDQDNSGTGDRASGSCSTVVDVVAGNEVQVVLRGSTDDTPLLDGTAYLYNGFNGFRI